MGQLGEKNVSIQMFRYLLFTNCSVLELYMTNQYLLDFLMFLPVDLLYCLDVAWLIT